jgi:hypothetical protein
MDSNPYVPPLARVEDAAPANSGVPRSVSRAVWILRLLLAGGVPVAMLLASVSSVLFQIFVLVGLGGALLFMLLSWPVSAGCSWARTVVLVCTPIFLLYAGICVALMVVGYASPKGVELTWTVVVGFAVVGGLTLLQGVAVIAANCFLWGKVSRQWFREKRRRQRENSPVPGGCWPVKAAGPLEPLPRLANIGAVAAPFS